MTFGNGLHYSSEKQKEPRWVLFALFSDISKVTKDNLNQTRFSGGKIPADDIQIAKIVNGIQEVTIKVNDDGYSPAAVILQRGMKAKIKWWITSTT
jgi:hypothetical protein